MYIDTCTQLTAARRLTSNPETLEEDIREKEIEELRQGRLQARRASQEGKLETGFLPASGSPTQGKDEVRPVLAVGCR